ncbi:MAG: hypothetical protein AB1763_11065 [Campylobacterota bacterium]
MERPTKEQVDQAIENAGLAFWATIAAAFPEIKTGDFPPDADYAFKAAQRDAVSLWLEWNHPALNEPEAQASPGAGDTPGGHEGA